MPTDPPHPTRRRLIGAGAAGALLLAIAVAWFLSPTAAGPGEPPPGSAGDAAKEAPELPERPNVLLVTLDTTRSDFVGGLRGDASRTPVLADLAVRSFAYPDAVSETNVTNPSHVSILSGLRAIQHGVFNNHAALAEDTDLLSLALRRRGYTTGAVLSIPHLAEIPGWRGFDHFEPVDGERLAPETADRALAWLEDRSTAANPFFLWVHFFDPHSLYDPPADLRAQLYPGDPTEGPGPRLADLPAVAESKGHEAVGQWLGDVRDPAYPRALYLGEVMSVDRELGRLLAGLEGLGLADDTVVTVVGDHGESLGEHEIAYSHRGLYEQQLRVPMILHVPGVAGERRPGPVSVLDVAPTLAALTGARLENPVSGHHLLPELVTPPPPAVEPAALLPAGMMVHQHAHNLAVALRDGRWKLIWPVKRDHPQFDDGPELYDLVADPAETRNLFAEQAERARRMRRILDPWIALGYRPNKPASLSEEQVRQLEALGYLQ